MNILKRITKILLCTIAVFMIWGLLGVKSEAASKTKQIITTLECSIWTRPNTTDKYRQKKIPAGHKVTVYTDVIISEKNDGKTFYKTAKGAYILCRCCDGNEISAKPIQPTPVIEPFSDSMWDIVRNAINNMLDGTMGRPALFYENVGLDVADTQDSFIRTTDEALLFIYKYLPEITTKHFNYSSTTYYVFGQDDIYVSEDNKCTISIDKSGINYYRIKIEAPRGWLYIG